ncbi:hypothetical protein RB201_23680 [Streptomyces sp. S1A(2023)]
MRLRRSAIQLTMSTVLCRLPSEAAHERTTDRWNAASAPAGSTSASGCGPWLANGMQARTVRASMLTRFSTPSS